MARYQPIVDIWTLDTAARGRLQVGQWVSAGPIDADRLNIGRFYGEGTSTVVAWRGNWRGRYRAYTAALRDYGRRVVKYR